VNVKDLNRRQVIKDKMKRSPGKGSHLGVRYISIEIPNFVNIVGYSPSRIASTYEKIPLSLFKTFTEDQEVPSPPSSALQNKDH